MDGAEGERLCRLVMVALHTLFAWHSALAEIE